MDTHTPASNTDGQTLTLLPTTPAYHYVGLAAQLEDTGPDWDTVIDYLYNAEIISDTEETFADVYHPEAGVVPSGYHSDGNLIWTRAYATYIARHHWDVHPELLNAVRNSQGKPPTLTASQRAAALRSVAQQVTDEQTIA